MGRKKKYHTEEERLDAKRKQQMDHYWRNKKELKYYGTNSVGCNGIGLEVQ